MDSQREMRESSPLRILPQCQLLVRAALDLPVRLVPAEVLMRMDPVHEPMPLQRHTMLMVRSMPVLKVGME